jgi:hypothetical protein
MIRIRYSNDEIKEYRTANLAKFMIANVLFSSNGTVIPVQAVEIFGITSGGVSVERDLKININVVDFE